MLLNATYHPSLMPRYQMQFTLKGKSPQYLYKVQTNIGSYLEKQDCRLFANDLGFSLCATPSTCYLVVTFKIVKMKV